MQTRECTHNHQSQKGSAPTHSQRPRNDGRTEVWSQTYRNAAHAATLRRVHLALPDRKNTLLQTQTHRCGWRWREIHCWWWRFIAWRAWLWLIPWTDRHPPHATSGWPSWSACRTGCPVDTERVGAAWMSCKLKAVIALHIFQTGTTSVRWRKWFTETGHNRWTGQINGCLYNLPQLH